LALDSEEGGRLEEAEVRFRTRVALAEAASSVDAPPLSPTEVEWRAGVAVEAEPGALLLGELALTSLVSARLDLCKFILRNRFRDPVIFADKMGAEEDGLSLSPVPNPLSLPGLGLGDSAYDNVDVEDAEALRNAVDSLGSNIEELRAVCGLVVGDPGKVLPTKLREDALLLFGATLLEHEISACPVLAEWVENSSREPWTNLPLTIPAFEMLGEMDQAMQATASVDDASNQASSVQPRRWSVSILEYALRLLFPTTPAEGPEGFSETEVMETKHCGSVHLAILAVALFATDSRRFRGYGDGPMSEDNMAENEGGPGNEFDPLGYSYGNEVRSRYLIRLGAAKWRHEFPGAKTRVEEDDETLLLLHAAEWFADHSLTAAGQIAYWMAKRCSIKSQQVVTQLKSLAETDSEMDPKQVESIKQLSKLTPKRVRLMAAACAARLSFRRVAIHDADAAAKQRNERHQRISVAPPGLLGELVNLYEKPARVKSNLLLAEAANRMDIAKLFYSDITNASSEFLLMIADLSWAQRLRDGGNQAMVDVRNNYGVFLQGALDVVPLRVFLRLGASMAELGDLESAASIYRRGCKEWPSHSSVWKGLGMCLMQMHRYAEAESMLGLSNERDHSDGLVWGYIALCSLKLMLSKGTTDDAYRMAAVAECIHQATSLGIDDIELLFQMSLAYAKCDRYKEASPLLHMAIELRQRMNDRIEAHGLTEMELSSNINIPSQETLMNCYGDAMKSQGKDLEALELYQSVIERCISLADEALGAPNQAQVDEEEKEQQQQPQQVPKLPEKFIDDDGSSIESKFTESIRQESVHVVEIKETISELNRAASSIDSLLLKLGRTSELKQLRFTVKMFNKRIEDEAL
jgi:tetratricopeptide (TPR) repeat protein